MRMTLGAVAALAVLAGCAPQSAGPARPAAQAADTGIVGTPAPGSKFSRIRIGMGDKEIEDLIGPPNDTSGHITGKAFIPFYFGSGTVEVDAHYKGEGVLTYESGGVGSTRPRLILITVDRSETGYVR